jgi:hypothetical protein
MKQLKNSQNMKQKTNRFITRAAMMLLMILLTTTKAKPLRAAAPAAPAAATGTTKRIGKEITKKTSRSLRNEWDFLYLCRLNGTACGAFTSGTDGRAGTDREHPALLL